MTDDIRKKLAEAERKVREALTPPESTGTCEVQAEIDANPEIKTYVDKELVRINTSLDATLKMQADRK